jgi:thiol-disulfide isomerase/thioredoxin
VNQTQNPTAQTAITHQVRTVRPRLIPILLLGLGIALAYRLVHDRARHQDPLRGNLEETPIALATVLERTPAMDRLPLLLTYTNDPNPALRYAALDQLGDQRAPHAADLLEQAFRDSDSKVREVGMIQLIQVDPNRGLRLALRALRDDDTWIREAAIMQLKTLQQHRPDVLNRKVVPNLIAALNDTDDTIPQTAMNLLRKLTGHNWFVRMHVSPATRQATVNRWKQWWRTAQSHWTTDPQLVSLTPLAPTRADPCPQFSLYSLDGRSVTVEGQRNHITLLNFWGRSCGPCIAESPALVEMDRHYRPSGVDVIGIDIGLGDRSEGQEINEIRDWCRAHNVAYTQTIATSAIREALGDIHDVPVTILLDRQGRIRYRWEGGPREPEVFAAGIERLLHE